MGMALTLVRNLVENWTLDFNLSVVDVDHDPAMAEQHNIIATPCLLIANGTRHLFVGDLRVHLHEICLLLGLPTNVEFLNLVRQHR